MKQRFAALIACLLALQLAGCTASAVPASVEATGAQGSIMDSLTELAAASTPDKNPQWKPFSIKSKGEYNLYSYQPAFMMYADMGNAALSDELPSDAPLRQAIKAIRALKDSPTAEINEEAMVEGGFLYVSSDGLYDKHLYLLWGGLLVVDGTGYSISTEQYNELKKIANDNNKNSTTRSAQWLLWMDPTRVVQAQTRVSDGEMIDVPKNNLLATALQPSKLNVIMGSTYETGEISFDEMFITRLTFDKVGGVTYTIAARGTDLYVESSDMQFACQYTVDTKELSRFIRTMRNLLQEDAGVAQAV